MIGFTTSRKNISDGYIDVNKQKAQEENNRKDRILAGIGSTSAVAITTAGIMKAQKIKNPFHIKYSVLKQRNSITISAKLLLLVSVLQSVQIQHCMYQTN